MGWQGAMEVVEAKRGDKETQRKNGRGETTTKKKTKRRRRSKRMRRKRRRKTRRNTERVKQANIPLIHLEKSVRRNNMENVEH